MTDAVTRRFIAGAVCPRCGEQDKIVVVSSPERRYRECVRCQFSEDLPEETNQGSQRELPTRVTRASARMVDTPAEPVTLLQPDDPASE